MILKPVPVEQADGLIYYARQGDSCKIGYTTKLYQRMQQLKPVELLAVEHGTMPAEWHRHEVFSRLRNIEHQGTEWFHYQDELREHVESLPMIEPYLQFRADLLERTAADAVAARRAVRRAWGDERRREGLRTARAARLWSPRRPHASTPAQRQALDDAASRALEEASCSEV